MYRVLVLRHCKASLILLGLGLLLFLPAAALSADYPKVIKQQLTDALDFYNQGKYSSARIQFNDALRQEPNCPEAYNGLGLCAMKEGHFQESNGCYLSAIKLKSDYFDALYNLANNYYMTSNYPEAITYYKRALDCSEKSSKQAKYDLLTALASVFSHRALSQTGLLRQQDMVRALDFYHKAIKLCPEESHAYADLGALYSQFGQFAAAEKQLRTAIYLKGDYAYAYFELGQLYRATREYPAALVALHNSLKFETVQQNKDETEKAMLELGIPSAIVEHFALGFEALNSGKWEASQSEFEAAAEPSTPLRAVALNNLGYANACGGKLANAIDDYKRALALSPQPEFYYNLGEAFYQINRLAEAEEAFKQCLSEAKGNHYLARNALGIILKAKGDFNGALKQYNLALLQSGGALTVVQFNRGLVLEKLGRNAEAAESYTKYLQSAPSGLNAETARKKLSFLQISK